MGVAIEGMDIGYMGLILKSEHSFFKIQKNKRHAHPKFSKSVNCFVHVCHILGADTDYYTKKYPGRGRLRPFPARSALSNHKQFIPVIFLKNKTH